MVSELHALGVRTVMVTGDAPETADIVARAIGLRGAICPPGPLPDTVHPETYAVFAGVLPEDKYKLVKAFQKGDHSVSMCGDGVNDAPALRQAQIGIAVSSANDVAKSAAGMVLTEPGLVGIVAAVKEGRVTFQRILTYTLNSITKKIVTVLFLIVGLIMTGQAILTPLLMVILMIAGDFLAMSLTTDHVRPSVKPNAWPIGRLTLAGSPRGNLSAVVLQRRSGRRSFRDGSRHPDVENSGVLDLGLWQPSRHLCDPRSEPSVGFAPEPMGARLIGGRCADRLRVGHRRLCDEPRTRHSVCQRACRGDSFAFVLDVVIVSVFGRLRIA